MALGALIRSTRTEGCVILRGRSVLVCAVSGLALMTFSFSAGADPVQPIGIPLKHVPSDDDATDFNSLGIMVGVNDAHPRLYQFDTGSDLFVGQFDEAMSDVQPLAGHKPICMPMVTALMAIGCRKSSSEALPTMIRTRRINRGGHTRQTCCRAYHRLGLQSG